MNKERQFRKKIYFRIGLYLFLLLTGIALGVLVFLIRRGDIKLANTGPGQFWNYYSGLALGIFIVALAKIAQNIYLLKNPNSFNKRMLAETDERNRYIHLKAWSVTGFIMFCLVFIISLVAGFYIPAAAWILQLIVMAFILTYALSYYILKRIN